MENKKYWIWFSLIKGLGCIRKKKLLELYKTPERIYNLPKEELLKVDGIGNEIVKNIVEVKNERLLDYHIKYMKENNLKLEQEIVSYYLVKDINYTIPPLY